LKALLADSTFADLIIDLYRHESEWRFLDAVIHSDNACNAKSHKWAILKFCLKCPHRDAKKYVAGCRDEDKDVLDALRELVVLDNGVNRDWIPFVSQGCFLGTTR
jgi:hypothetical protein